MFCKDVGDITVDKTVRVDKIQEILNHGGECRLPLDPF